MCVCVRREGMRDRKDREEGDGGGGGGREAMGRSGKRSEDVEVCVLVGGWG